MFPKRSTDERMSSLQWIKFRLKMRVRFTNFVFCFHLLKQKKIQATLRLDERKKQTGANKVDLNNNRTEKDSITVQLNANPTAEKAESKANQEQLPNILDYSLVGDRAVIFSLDNQVGGLVRALRIFQASIDLY